MENSNGVYAVTDRLDIRQFGLHDVQSFNQYRANLAASRFQSWENTYADAEAFVRKQMSAY